MPEAPTYIPQTLVDFLHGCIADGAEAERLKPLAAARVLSDEEIHALEGEAVIWEVVGRFLDPEGGAGPYPGYLLLEADGDNDGILDILAITTEGSGGFTTLTYFQGRDEGGYRVSYEMFNLLSRSEYDVISYDGANYLLAASFDYNTKIYDGLEVFCFRDGVLVEKVFVQRTVAGFQRAEEQGDPALADQLEHAAADLREPGGGYPQRAGSGEREDRSDSGRYTGDLDNDGTPETYVKHTWYPSTFFSAVSLHFAYEGQEDGPVYDLLALLGEEGWQPQLLWADREARGNVVYTVSTDWDDCIRSDAWFLSGGARTQLASVILEPDYEVVPQIYTCGTVSKKELVRQAK